MQKKQKILSIIFIVLVAILIICSPLTVPYKISSVAKLIPGQQLILSRGPDGEILTNTINNISGVNDSYQLTSFERGESMILDLNKNINNDQFVNKGDTLGIIYSNNQQEKLLELNGQLQILTATLEASMSGVKQPEVRAAQERLEMAKSEYAKQQKIVIRQKKLLEKDIIAVEEYQTEADALVVLEKAINVREAELESSLTGEKAEEINLQR